MPEPAKLLVLSLVTGAGGIALILSTIISFLFTVWVRRLRAVDWVLAVAINIPVIIYSTSSEKRDIEETTRLGAAHFLTKPNKFEELCKALSFVVSKDWSQAS